ncbi:type I-U CRISPR-associated protein Csb2 [Raineyella sp. W15-4]|uniref:type I-G CRISPR-associated protein Csb2 n=1 Tax=Raineyella sp. W15-4 TaxID=3081651 RepID=UPI0029536BFA|nr:type I-U CRISPR-associated protein Csb2 [Raineyella sp. W15-4]WOQ16524.1 type I-U CRISPR-associated protein Csb2 [Raineyella sp. W15-4]
MPTLTVTARFPLGVFAGHGADGSSVDPFPSTKRLHSALMHAAGKGSLAILRSGDLRPADASLAALEWLETHIPHAIQHPTHCSTRVGTREPANAYRAEGTFDKAKTGGHIDRKVRKQVTNAIAVNGAFGWEWSGVPASVCRVVEVLCEDVSCLGEADSPVVLSTQIPLSAPMPLVEGAGQFTRRGMPVQTPSAGRTRELEDAYDRDHPLKHPDPKADRFIATQGPRPSEVTTQRVRNAYYEAPDAPIPESPWVRTMLFPIDRPIAQKDRVGWCVAFHRTLATRLGDDAPPVITGSYGKGVLAPPNRVAIQILDQSVLHQTSNAHRYISTPAAFAVLVPRDIAPADERLLLHAIGSRMRVFRRGGAVETSLAVTVPAGDFWQAPAAGAIRTWAAVPALVAETRRQRSDEAGPWTLAHAALLSLGFVFRPDSEIRHGADGYRDLIQYARAQGAKVLSAQPVADSRVDRYAHKLPQGVVAQVYRAHLDLGQLTTDTSLIVAGQSRHIGGGLLVPVDLPSDVVDAWSA